MAKKLFYFTMILLTYGCQSSTPNNAEVSIIGSEASGNMVLNKLYIMYPGNKIEKKENATKVQVLHLDKNDNSTVKLLAGKAIIIR